MNRFGLSHGIGLRWLSASADHLVRFGTLPAHLNRLSARKIARIRKDHLLAGEAWEFEEQKKMWPPLQNRVKKRVKSRAKRQRMIKEAMAAQPAKIEQWKRETRIRRGVKRMGHQLNIYDYIHNYASSKIGLNTSLERFSRE